ncbi:uncharacterized protein (TIGR02646 family) [Arcicella aurantiaca]|uniref:Uncharacterized protein (TIGR02646 family) n=1 Tax=Arcicella aurantiaca TaxID=591202 RepID=A0A316EGS2_9BACT|nr:HNH endonuclease [Arcicella aurantiaca]PWK28908.1 uncharacterized protein (TIGR02646 family) [Arcicella aurantiaca]
MIQLKSVPLPKLLTEKLREELTNKFKANKKENVWNKPYIKKALLKMSNSKCCYSECKLDEKSNYMEIEHFHAKSIYPDKVVEWANLLPSSKRCNGKKDNWDVIAEPIIHPVLDNPKDHLYLKNFRLYGRTQKGKNTIIAVDLNDRQHWVNPRFDMGSKIQEKLEEIEEQLPNLQTDKTKRRLIKTLKNILREGTKDYEFSAVAATIILHDDNYILVKRAFQDNDLWDNEFKELEIEVEYCAMDIKA